MKEDSKYSINFIGLSEGKHEFSYQIAKDFLEDYPETEIKDLDFDVKVIMEKTSRHLGFEFHIEGAAMVQCDRCLDNFSIDLSFDKELYVIFGDETSDLTDIDDRMILSRKENEIDLSKHLYDYINLQIPIQNIHPNNEKGESLCNIEMLEKIEKYMGSEESPSNQVDPRWDKLKSLYN